ncbi:hypothetical protein HYH02_006300 [Chlamydomonas schloesseri]|uniref:Carbohydrate kinase PfkB domain-containing protein n=1 Tax=Chlamydomonas schloesseri TaxID=2026947 RepID=A0A835WIT8_9CHLO|nr:hypothetical protein HYH02_006300 [Chlamydomonas schloesseri]|eukprot:KAG2448408.1 hypothetical protein HYH02_006300 [Chlamydomonas schloesseri]
MATVQAKVDASTFQGCNRPLGKRIKVVGMGSCGVDYLASVAAYPRPDEKLRTEKLETQGGGNCANALTAAARLGLYPTLVTKIGGDGLGDGILSELHADGIDTTHVLRAAGHPSPFTYIIVDRQGGTRTCIHTPGAPLEPGEMTAALLEGALAGAALVYFDGRLTEAAVLLAREARRRGIPVLVEAERLRPGLELLLAEADYVVTSAHFPQDWTGEANLADAVLATAERLPAARWVVTTMGTRGSVLLERPPAANGNGNGNGNGAGGALRHVALHDVMESELEPRLRALVAEVEAEAVCVAETGQVIGAGHTASTDGYVQLKYSAPRDRAQEAAAAAAVAAERAAALNADSGRGAAYAAGNSSAGAASGAAGNGLVARVTLATIATLPKEAVVDTTGAGDSFIGSILYGLCTGMSLPGCMRLGAVVAAAKCTQLGARPGLPTRCNLSQDLLHEVVDKTA